MRVDATQQQVPGSYDGALLLDVLEHLPDDRLALGHVRDQLARDGAVVIFTVPAFQFLWSPWDDMHHHRRRYTVKTASELAEACGLEVLRATYFFSPLFFAAGLVKLVRTATRPLRGGKAVKVEDLKVEDLIEGKTNRLITSALLSVLAVERAFLRHRDLPLGTSVICAARIRSAS
jgi:2-polyprenyl-3-methyl-5-hydroxy-6-metoxy-1,4-benzoquinol methylase